MDLLEQLGSLAFASRLRRLADRLHRDVSQIYREQDVDFEARWFPVLYALQQGQSRSITDLASALGLTHPAINQIVGAMAKRGLVNSRKDRKDERRRLITLSAAGKKLVGRLQPLWEEISAATSEMIKQGGRDFLQDVERLEKSLDQVSMYERVARRLKARLVDDVEIIEFAPRLKHHFADLNREWLEEYFEVEPTDAAILNDPQGKIIKPGGAILFARLHGEIVGTAALLPHEGGYLELTKMAVTGRQRGNGIGKKLAEAVLARAKQLGARDLYLLTSPELTAAVALYHKLGFKECTAPQVLTPKFCRCTIVMKKKL